MWGFASSILAAIANLLKRLASLIASLAGPRPPVLLAIRPTSGWPGTVVTIDGAGFSDSLDDNWVVIGGQPALVMRASPNQLTVLVDQRAESGAINVSTGGVTTTSSQSFQIRPWPDLRDSASSGPPVFFHGPQEGTPALRRKGQRVLVIFAQGSDTPPVNEPAEISIEMASFSDAERFWREASYDFGPASHGTSVKFETGPWVHLPRPRNAYVWDDGDIAWARGELFLKTKRWTAVVGDRAYCAHQGGGLSIADVTGTNWPREVAKIGSWIAYHVVVSGNTAFVAAGSAGVVAITLAGAVSAVIGTIASGGNARACDLTGTTLLAAAMHGGLEIYDVANPAAMVRRSVIDAGEDWATCVKRVGKHAYVGAGKFLRVYDVANPGAPLKLGEAPTSAWVLGLDVVGSTCVVATDGGGLAIYDISSPNPVPKGNLQDALHVFNVRFGGSLAYAACGADGILIADVSDPAKPERLALMPTGAACYDVMPPFVGDSAIMSLGARAVAAANFADPKHPTLLGPPNLLSSTPPLGEDYDLGALRTNLNNASTSRGSMKGDALFVHALLSAMSVSPQLNLDAFEGIVVVIHGMPGRGQSGLYSQVSFEALTIEFREKKGLICLASHTKPNVRTTWGRKAHEIGHWFGMRDIYTEQFDDGTVKVGDAEGWDMAGSHDLGPLFSGHLADHMQLFDSASIARRRWRPTIPPGPELFEIVAHGANEDTVGRFHLLQLQVTNSLSYYVEVREKPAGLIFDQQLPQPGSVLVTRVDEEQSVVSNTFEQPTMLFGVLATGESVVDAARLLRIEAGPVLQATPLVYRVIVHWNEEPEPDPNGKFDLRIEPWSTETWETPDIWVNSLRNDKGGAPIYSDFEAGDETKPRRNGDRPWVHHKNTIFARVSNSGGQDAKDVYVTCYVNSPPGIGDNGSWETLKTEKLASIAADSFQIVQFEWTPTVDKHTCISVAIFPQVGERSPKNNRAQENVASFDSAGSSSHEPVVLEAMVRSPFSVWRRVDLRVRGLPVGWHAVVDKAWVWVPPKGSVPVTTVIWTELNSPRQHQQNIPTEAFARVEGWTDFAAHQYIPIGGILAAVRANKRTRIAFEARVAPARLQVLAWLQPPAAGVPGIVEVTDAAGAPRLLPVVSDAGGLLMADIPLAPGHYDVQVFTSSTAAAAEAESDLRRVEVPQ